MRKVKKWHGRLQINKETQSVQSVITQIMEKHQGRINGISSEMMPDILSIVGHFTPKGWSP